MWTIKVVDIHLVEVTNARRCSPESGAAVTVIEEVPRWLEERLAFVDLHAAGLAVFGDNAAKVNSTV